MSFVPELNYLLPSFPAIVLHLPGQMLAAGRDGCFRFKSSPFFLPVQPQPVVLSLLLEMV